MINPTVKIVGAGIGIGGVVSGSAVGIYQLTKQPSTDKKKTQVVSKKISEWFEGTTITLLGSDPTHADTWNTKWQSFQAANKPTVLGGHWTMNKWTEKQGESTAPEEFKSLCRSNSEKHVSSKLDTLYLKVVEYCAK
ncbi:hypothetical protein A6V39_03500 [Candidatus Mycoplasma haematobovis]|uniref:Uncharacterized protein n=1 Tax=Candidatus Mycoplasma haematobovis TaxID=432608 RepID=A0A1A9QD63_9MOLU|nr:hypothetical protein [Candidatus Mycoplasma haematobovis]OAL09951.1 hypothetical protein A6V39_03500 [Candidatus Mycoplasma haematobovis]